MPSHGERMRTLDAIRRSAIHQSISSPSSRIAMMRHRNSPLNDPLKALDNVRAIVQKDITSKIKEVLDQYVQEFFSPAIENVKKNLGEENINGESLMEHVCMEAIEQAKVPFRSQAKVTALSVIKSEYGAFVNPSLTIEPTVLKATVKKPSLIQPPPQTHLPPPPPHLAPPALAQPPPPPPQPTTVTAPPPPPPILEDLTPLPLPPVFKRKPSRPNTDLILISKQGKPVRREGPSWDPKRLTSDTMFILGSKANKALGLGQTRGRLYMKHPELFKYSGDQEDKEWLTKHQVMSTTGGKAYLMVLQDIVNLSQTEEYASHPKLKLDELVGFQIPSFMLMKMQRFMADVQTDPGIPDDVLLAEAREHLAKIELEMESLPAKKPKMTKKLTQPLATAPDTEPSTSVQPVVMDDLNPTTTAAGQEEIMLNDDCEIVSANVVGAAATGEDQEDEDDLGSFLHGVNLTTLVKEFENATSESGNLMSPQHLDGILSLAADDDEVGDHTPFPELPEEPGDHEESPEENHDSTTEEANNKSSANDLF